MSRQQGLVADRHFHSESVFLPMVLIDCADASFPYTPHIPINTPKVNNFRQQTGALRCRMEMEGGAKRDRNIHRYSEGIEGAAGMPERPSWLSFGLPGNRPGVPKYAHLCRLGWSLRWWRPVVVSVGSDGSAPLVSCRSGVRVRASSLRVGERRCC